MKASQGSRHPFQGAMTVSINFNINFNLTGIPVEKASSDIIRGGAKGSVILMSLRKEGKKEGSGEREQSERGRI